MKPKKTITYAFSSAFARSAFSLTRIGLPGASGAYFSRAPSGATRRIASGKATTVAYPIRTSHTSQRSTTRPVGYASATCPSSAKLSPPSRKPTAKTHGSWLYCHVRMRTANPKSVIRTPIRFTGRCHQASRPVAIAVQPITTAGSDRISVWWRSPWSRRKAITPRGTATTASAILSAFIGAARARPRPLRRSAGPSG